ncbi:MAG: hypothetical protein U5L04_04175 [Trueperaceae bacterium]|nr:hypothetical protein [Trueperaceae bacterium]
MDHLRELGQELPVDVGRHARQGVQQLPHVDVHGVADVERDRQPDAAVQSRLAAPVFGVVFDVVVNEYPVLEELEPRRQL